MTEEEANKIVDKYVDALMEHFDSVQILGTYRQDGGEFTIGISRGGGNFYARKGMIVEWMEKQQAQNIASEINDR